MLWIPKPPILNYSSAFWSCAIAVVLVNVTIRVYRRYRDIQLGKDVTVSLPPLRNFEFFMRKHMNDFLQYIKNSSKVNVRHEEGENKVSAFERLRLLPGQVDLRDIFALTMISLIEVLINLVYKFGLYAYTLAYFFAYFETFGFASASKRHREKIGVMVKAKDCKVVSRRRIYFIRHAESLWNYGMNRGLDVGIVYRVSVVLGNEALLLADYDSAILDAPLSAVGVGQATQLQQALLANAAKSNPAALNEMVQIMNSGAGSDLVFITSNLRRAISTMGIALHPWFQSHSSEKVLINSDLQESTRNMDGYSLTQAHTTAPASKFERRYVNMDMPGFYNETCIASSTARKKITATLESRLVSLTEWLFRDFGADLEKKSQTKSKESVPTAVICGHSGWLRAYFQYYLPPAETLPYSSKKIPNCSILKFELLEYASETSSGETALFCIDAKSVELMNGKM